MKVLFIVQSFLPYGGAVNHLLINLIESNAFKKNEILCDVLTLKNQYTDKDAEMISGISIYRLENEYAYQVTNAKQMLSSLRGVKVCANKCFRKIVPSKIGELDQRMVKRIVRFLLKNAQNYDVIVSVSGRVEMVEGYRVFAEANRCIDKGVLYQVDPMADNQAFDIRVKKSMEKLEREIYRKFGYVLTTPILYKDNFAHGYPMDRVCGIEFPMIQPVVEDLKPIQKSDRIKCLFSGYLHHKLRSPEYTLKLFSCIQREDITLNIVGKGYEELVDQYQKYAPEGRIIRSGLLMPDEVKQYQDEADILVNIGNSCTNMVPSKIFEYINTGKPILNICKNHNCPSLDYLDRYPLILTLFEDEPNMELQVARVNTFIDNIIGRRVASDEIMDIYRDCTIECVAERISNVLIGCSAN